MTSVCTMESMESRCLLNSAGQLDPSFGDHGRFVDNGVVINRPVDRMIVQNDGKTILARSVDNTLYLERYTDAGAPDATFASGGHESIAIPSNGLAQDLLALADGCIEVTTGDVVIRVRSDGQLDPTLNPGGTRPGIEVLQLPPGASGPITHAAIQPDGKIVYTANGDASDLAHWTDLYVVRLNLDGSFDPTFGNGGVSLKTSGFYFTVHSLFVQDNGVIDIAGHGTSRGNSNPGIIDRFDSSGQALSRWLSPDEIADVQAALPWFNKTVLFTYQSTGPQGYRILSADGKTATPLKLAPATTAAGTATVQPLAFGPGGMIYAGGSIPNANGGTDFAIARYTPTGALDTTFGAGGVTTVAFPSGDFHDVVQLALAPGDCLVAAGDSDSIHPALARLLTDSEVVTNPSPGHHHRYHHPHRYHRAHHYRHHYHTS